MLFNTNDLRAYVVRGGDLQVKLLDKSKVEITFSVFVQCGSPLTYPNISLITPDGTVVPLQANQFGGWNITPGCGGGCNTCYNSACNFKGLQQYSYIIIADISKYSGCNFKVNVEQCCRTGDLKVIQNSPTLFLEAEFNRCLQPALYPNFNLMPPFFLYKNRCTSILFNAEPNGFYTDSDDDSISYELVPTLRDSGKPVTYNNSFTYDKPLRF